MKTEKRTYIAIDLKSFYASVECAERGLDPLDTNLVVADVSRTDKTICLAVTPALKARGIPGRPRLFEVVQRLRLLNDERRKAAPHGSLIGASTSDCELKANPALKIDYIIAPPRMALYMDYSTRIFRTYLKFVAPEDIHSYSVDEVFIDATPYLKTMRMTGHEMARTMIREVLRQTGITATAGIGSNMYLCKVAMDIKAKRMPPDADGVRIAELDEESWRREMWHHEPLTDFWRVGRGVAARLAAYGVKTMGDIARMSLQHEDTLYRLFGVNAELLMDHAWGREPCTMAMIKSYRPSTRSLCHGQVLTSPYTTAAARVVAKEMAEALAFRLLEKRMVADRLTLDVGYDVDNIQDPTLRASYTGVIATDRYGRSKPKTTHGSAPLGEPTSSAALIMSITVRLFDLVATPGLHIRRLNLTASNVTPEITEGPTPIQLELFTDYEALAAEKEAIRQRRRKERMLMETELRLKKRFGKNSVLRGLDFREGATTRERNCQIGGHKA